MNSSQIRKFSGFLGFGFRELTAEETDEYCADASSVAMATPPLTSAGVSFRDSVSVRIISSGCYFMNTSNGQWSTEGVVVIEAGTNSSCTHCQSTHLTQFVGGFLVFPEPINFDYSLANASFSINKTIYAVIITVACLYAVLAIVAVYFDVKDYQKTGICVLDGDDYFAKSSYFYEIIVNTGNRRDAGTDSKVKFIVSGEKGETSIKSLSNRKSKRKILRRGAVDSFIFTTDK